MGLINRQARQTMKRLCGSILLTTLAVVLGCAEPVPDKTDKGKTQDARVEDKFDEGKDMEKKIQRGVEYQDLVEGEGPEAKEGDTVLVHYTGWLENGKKFDSSRTSGQPFPFVLGRGVIQGWSIGVAGMKVGGRRKLYIPSRLGYGSGGFGEDIPPDANLIFTVEMLKIKR
jgi:FKBP-type peptidyl-prolyl cis-trans isomerase